MKSMKTLLLCSVLVLAVLSRPAPASGDDRMPGSEKPAIVLAAFGTTAPEAIDSILNIKRRVEATFPGYDVHLAFTSNIVRKIWHERANDDDFKKNNPGIPPEIYSVTNVISALARVQEEGFRPVLVQSLHVTDGEEYHDLAKLVETLGNYETAKPRRKPFPAIGLGAPALGTGDGEEAYLRRAARAFADLAAEARATGAALVLMAHANEHLTQSVFGKMEAVLRELHGPQIYIGTVEAPPLVDDVIAAVKSSGGAPGKVLLAPLMVVAGDHALNDMAGDDEDSWAARFRAAGFGVECHLVGLGANAAWADIYVEHLKEVEKRVIGK